MPSLDEVDLTVVQNDLQLQLTRNFGRSGMRWKRAKVTAEQTVNRVASSRGLNSG